MKHPNPIKGYLKCPVCSSTATTHMCGEGQLLATGEPPKNSRNLGLHYYKCPECGNQQISKKGSEYVLNNMVADESQLEREQVTESVTVNPVFLPDAQPLEAKETKALSVEVATESVTEEITETPLKIEDKKAVVDNRLVVEKPRHRWLAIGGLVCFAVFVFLQFKPKVTVSGKAEQGVSYGE